MAAVRLAHSVFGTGSSGRTPALVLHDLFGSGNNWRTIAGRLAWETNRLVYTLDARNHGETEHSSEMTYDLMSRDTMKFIQDRGLSKVILIGHSMGGKTAMATALSHPEVIERLVVVDVSPRRVPGEGESTDLIKAMKNLDVASLKNRREADLLLKKDVKDFSLRQFLLTNLVPSNNGESKGSRFRSRFGKGDPLKWKINLDAIASNIQRLKDFPLFESVYDKPTLFIGGADSNYISSEDVPEIKQLFPDATISHIQGAGHWAHFEQPDEFLRLTNQFLSNRA